MTAEDNIIPLIIEILNFLEKYGWTEIIGLRGPITSNRVACGFYC